MTADVVVLRPPAPPDELVYPNHVAFYEAFLAPIFPQLEDAEPGWCPQWRDHPAAENGVAALWRAWEILQQDPGPGQASWLANLAIPIMRELRDDDGPFRGCSPARHTPTAMSLPVTQ